MSKIKLNLTNLDYTCPIADSKSIIGHVEANKEVKFIISPSSALYEYSSISGTGVTPTIDASLNVTFTMPNGDGEITAIATEKELGNTTLTLTHCTATTTQIGSTMKITIIPDDGYKLPSQSEISLSGITLTSYSETTGEMIFNLPISEASITIEATILIYSITANIINGTSSGDTQISQGGTAVITITPNGGYKLPDDITVINAIKSYDKITGVITLSNPTGNVTITASCIRVYKTSITFSDSGSANPTSVTLASGGTGTSSITGAQNYSSTSWTITCNPTSTTASWSGTSTSSKSATLNITQGAADCTITLTTCLPEDTLIMMADGTQRLIQNIKEGDLVRTYNFEIGRFENSSVVFINNGGKYNHLITLELEDGTKLRYTGGHHDVYDPVAHIFRAYGNDSEEAINKLSETEDYYIAKEVNGKMKAIKVVNIIEDNSTHDMYTICAENTLTVLADGALVGYGYMNNMKITKSNKFSKRELKGFKLQEKDLLNKSKYLFNKFNIEFDVDLGYKLGLLYIFKDKNYTNIDNLTIEDIKIVDIFKK